MGLHSSRDRRRPEQVLRIIEVQAWQAMESGAVVYMGVGLTGQNIHFVPQLAKCMAQMADIDALSSTMGIATIAQKADTKRAVLISNAVTFQRWVSQARHLQTIDRIDSQIFFISKRNQITAAAWSVKHFVSGLPTI